MVTMSERERAEAYETAIKRFQEHLRRAEDGTFRLEVPDGGSIGVDPIVFADLRRSLEETNEKIRRKEIDPKDVEYAP